MDILTAFIVFVASIFALVKGADYLIKGSERIGVYFGLPSFVIGALIVGIGTSLPELASSLAAILVDQGEIVVANAVGSNIANILLVVGLAAVIGRKVVSTKDLLNIEVPLLVIATVLFLGTAYDGVVTIPESVILFAGFLVYLSYLLVHPDDSAVELAHVELPEVKKLRVHDFVMLIGGGLALVVGAHYMIDAVIVIAESFGISTGIIGITAIAVGTSLPEIIVSVTAVLQGKTDLAFGNVFGSNIFNMLMMVGFIGFFGNLSIDMTTYLVGLPILVAATVIFTISCMSKTIYIWEGLLFLIFYVFFMIKIFGGAYGLGTT